MPTDTDIELIRLALARKRAQMKRPTEVPALSVQSNSQEAAGAKADMHTPLSIETQAINAVRRVTAVVDEYGRRGLVPAPGVPAICEFSVGVHERVELYTLVVDDHLPATIEALKWQGQPHHLGAIRVEAGPDGGTLIRLCQPGPRISVDEWQAIFFAHGPIGHPEKPVLLN